MIIGSVRPRLTYFVLGLLVTTLSWWLVAHWLDITSGVFGMNVVYDTRPAWLRAVMFVVGKAPMGVLAILLAIRVARGPIVRPLAFAGGIVVFWVFLAGSFFIGPAVQDYAHRREFEPAGWRKNERTDAMRPTRITMVDDLLARHRLRGLSSDSVGRLLGPGDSTSYWPEWDLVYWLGPERGLGVDSEWLVLRFAADSTVSEFEVVRD